MSRSTRLIAAAIMSAALAIAACSSDTDKQRFRGSGEESFTIDLRRGWVDFWVDLYETESDYLRVTIVDASGQECLTKNIDDSERLSSYYTERSAKKAEGWWVFGGGSGGWKWKFGPQPVGKRGTDGTCAEGQALVEVRTSSDASKWTFEVRPTSTARAH